jgi:hypothetical protein
MTLRTPIAAALFVCAAAAQDWLDLARRKDFAAFRSSSNNADPASNDDSKRPIPGETIVLADLEGPGAVTHIWITVAANEYGWPRLLRFRVYYDGSSVPSVDAPLGDFFGVGHGVEKPVNSLMVRDSSSGRSRNCYWPMPFRKRCKITLTNEGRRRVSNVYYHVDWKRVPRLADDVAYFHARYRQELPAVMGKRYEILNVRGRGHYAGTVLNVIQNQAGWFGEGDEFFYVDGAAKPGIEGTGSEDYFNDAWSLRVAEGPYTGVPVAEGTGVGSRMTAYRWHLPDPVPFRTSLRFEIEHAGWTYDPGGRVRSAFEERADLFSSVAFWYQEGIAQGLPEPPYGAARLPHGNATQIEVEQSAAEVKTEGGKAEVQKEVFWSRDLLLFRAQGAGSRIEIPFDVTEDGNYELLAQIAHAPDYGVYTVLLDGKPLGGAADLEHEPGANLGGGPGIDAYHSEVYVAEDHVLGWARLKAGRHTLAFVCTGKNFRSSGHRLGIDTLVLSKIAQPQHTGGERAERLRRAGVSEPEVASGFGDSDPWVRQAAVWAATQQPALAARQSVRLASLLKDPDATVRGLAALALGGSGKAALAELRAALKDTEASVRIAAADTLASFGADAAAAIPELIAVCENPAEVVHVQRSVASALGAMGPAARAAAPCLRRLEALPRVRWAASAAIARIERGAKAP